MSIDHVRPLVIIPARFSEVASALRYEAEVAAAKLLDAVWDAGGEPLVVHPTALREPEVEQPHPTLYHVDETQDAFDLAMARWAIVDQIPLLAICRGNQVVNVALGGTLVQDMTEQIGRTHRQFVHDIELDDDSPLREVVTDDRITISCSHHQCIANLGERLVAAAHAADGTIEAVTLAEHDAWYLGVQWHLEDFADTDPIQHGIFRAFVAAAATQIAASV